MKVKSDRWEWSGPLKVICESDDWEPPVLAFYVRDPPDFPLLVLGPDDKGETWYLTAQDFVIENLHIVELAPAEEIVLNELGILDEIHKEQALAEAVLREVFGKDEE